MTQINPAHILIAVVVLCVAMMASTAFLTIRGLESYVPMITAFLAPIIFTLLGLKIEVIRRIALQKEDEIKQGLDKNTKMTANIEQKVNGHRDDTIKQIAHLEQTLASTIPAKVAEEVIKKLPGNGNGK